VPHQYKTKPKPGTVRHTVQQLHNATDPKFAVFMRSDSGCSAKFKTLHETYDVALDAARQHAATAVGHGNINFTYYVIEVKHRVGIENGKPVDSPMN
jgi:hypothetical protein